MKVEIYTDGSATTADKPGGWAYVIIVDGKVYRERSGHLGKATNNVAELTAAIEGLTDVAGDIVLRAAPEKYLVSDSQLVLKYATGEYQCRKFHLVPLYIKLKKLYGELNATTSWVRGHSGNEHNERCDKLANAARVEVQPSKLDAVH
jgi:ribonuclease HI